MEVEETGENPSMSDPKWEARHYKCLIHCGGRRATFYYSMGMSHEKEPELEGVLDCLASDVSSVVCARHFEEWARDLGYDTDSRRAEAIYKSCLEITRKLKRIFVDENAFKELLFNTERL
jgi:hypothetical protein